MQATNQPPAPMVVFMGSRPNKLRAPTEADGGSRKSPVIPKDLEHRPMNSSLSFLLTSWHTLVEQSNSQLTHRRQCGR
jgi:hypothetical protein